MSIALIKRELYGSSLRRQNVSTFSLSERRYAPNFETPSHTHERALLCFVLDGSYTEISGGRRQDCRPSTFLYHPAGYPHAEHFHANGGRSLIVEIAPSEGSPLADTLARTDDPLTYRAGSLPFLAARLHSEFERFDAFSALIVEGLICEIVGEVARQQRFSLDKRAPYWLRSVVDLLHAQYSERLSLEKIASDVDIHPVHLAQSFRKHYQTTVGGYVRRLRLESCRRELSDTARSLSDIASANGFCDQSHFTRLFKREYGTTPKAFRDKSRAVR
jgi:AraC family transcriptional regulator